MMEKVVKLSEYKKRKRCEVKRREWMPLWRVAGIFLLAVALVFGYLMFMGGRP